MADIPNMDDLLNQLEEQCRKERQSKKAESPFGKARPPDPPKSAADAISLIHQKSDSFHSISGEQSNENGHRAEVAMERKCETSVDMDLKLTASPCSNSSAEIVQRYAPMICTDFATSSAVLSAEMITKSLLNGFNEPDIVQTEEKPVSNVDLEEKSAQSDSETEEASTSSSTLDESFPPPVAAAPVAVASSDGSVSDDEASSSATLVESEPAEKDFGDLPNLPKETDVNDLIEGDLDAQLAELEAELLVKGLIKESEIHNHMDVETHEPNSSIIAELSEKSENIPITDSEAVADDDSVRSLDGSASEEKPLPEVSEASTQSETDSNSQRSVEGSTNEEKMAEIKDLEETIAAEGISDDVPDIIEESEIPPSPPPSPKNMDLSAVVDIPTVVVTSEPLLPQLEASNVEINSEKKLSDAVLEEEPTEVSDNTETETEIGQLSEVNSLESVEGLSNTQTNRDAPQESLIMLAETDEPNPSESKSSEEPSAAEESIEDNVFVEETELPTAAITDESSAAAAEEAVVSGPQRSVILSTHAVGNVGTDLRLTESELQLGKSKPVWIRDEDCKKCMICTARFTLVNRRHHCRCCGRVLCAECCSLRRLLPYMTDGKKQRVCVPCNSTLDRIELYEKTMENMRDEQPAVSSADPQPSTSNATTAVASTTQRKKSVLKQRPRSEAPDADSPQRLAEFILGRHATRADSNDSGDQSDTPPMPTVPRRDQPGRRSVKFLDGVSPGDEHIISPPRSVAGTSRANRSKHSSRRSRAIVGVEEGLDLTTHCLYTCANPSAAQLSPLSDAEFASRLTEGYPVRLCLTRNIHLLVHLIEYEERWVYALYTDGFYTVGVEELLLVFERCPSQVSTPPQHICRAFFRFIELSLQPTTDLLDDRMGIRQCASRMSSLFELNADECEGHRDVAAVLFHPYHHQDLTGIPHPSRIFRVGLFVQNSELPFVEAMSSRFVHRLGMLANKFPAPVVNEFDRPVTFEAFADASELSTATILSMFHDFRTKTYQLNRVAGSTALISERTTRVCLPDWTAQQVKSIVDSNTNLLGWACDLSMEADSVLVCEKVQSSFASRVFSKDNSREKIGAAFVAFSTGHKGPENDFTPTLVEDGVVVRLHSDSMELLQKRLANGENFFIETAEHSLEVVWIPGDLITAFGAISSPVDGMDLRGYYQYGLLLNRALNSNSAFLFDKTFALRLGTVVHLHPQRMDRQHRSKFFDACEQFAVWLKTPLEQWAATLLAMDIHEICVRLHLSQTNFDYLVAPWIGLEDAHAEFSICVGEKLMPFLAYMTSSSAVDFFVELHLPIVSIRPISSASTPIPPPSASNYAPAESQPVNVSESEENQLTEPEPTTAEQ